jgi:CheY-like chemotaxis protein
MSEPIKVLVIDDQRFILSATRMLLSRAGFEVRTAENGEEGMLLWKTWRPDCVLLDLMMPGLSGWEVLERMRSSGPEGQIPVFLFSAKDDDEARRQALLKGANGFILKPFDPDDLAKRIRNAVRAYRVRL